MANFGTFGQRMIHDTRVIPLDNRLHIASSTSSP
jgi:hypothetical protein